MVKKNKKKPEEVSRYVFLRKVIHNAVISITDCYLGSRNASSDNLLRSMPPSQSHELNGSTPRPPVGNSTLTSEGQSSAHPDDLPLNPLQSTGQHPPAVAQDEQQSTSLSPQPQLLHDTEFHSRQDVVLGSAHASTEQIPRLQEGAAGSAPPDSAQENVGPGRGTAVLPSDPSTSVLQSLEYEQAKNRYPDLEPNMEAQEVVNGGAIRRASQLGSVM